MPDLKELLRIDRNSKVPLYDLIEQNFRQLISNEVLKPGDLIPSEWELAGCYGVSRLTIRRALDELSRQGWLERRHGVGTFVAHPTVTQIAPSKLSFTEQMRAIGRQPSSRLIHIRAIPATEHIASHLKLHPGDHVIEIMRLRMADSEPILLETAYLSIDRFPGLEQYTELSHASLYEHLSTRYNTHVITMDQTLEPVILSASEAQYLEAREGMPAIFSEVVAYNHDGAPIEYSQSVTRGDRCKFFFRFRRGESTL